MQIVCYYSKTTSTQTILQGCCAFVETPPFLFIFIGEGKKIKKKESYPNGKFCIS